MQTRPAPTATTQSFSDLYDREEPITITFKAQSGNKKESKTQNRQENDCDGFHGYLSLFAGADIKRD